MGRLFAWWMAWRFFRIRPRYTFDELAARGGPLLPKGTRQTGLLAEGRWGLQWTYLPGKVQARDVRGMYSHEHLAVWWVETQLLLAAKRVGGTMDFGPIRRVVWYQD